MKDKREILKEKIHKSKKTRVKVKPTIVHKDKTKYSRKTKHKKTLNE